MFMAVVISTGKLGSSKQIKTKFQGGKTVGVENNQGKTVNTDKPKTEETSQKPLQTELSNKLDILQKPVLSIRPTKSSELKVVQTIDIMGIRPIAANTINIVDEINASGTRPIAASNLVVSKKYSLMGNRPIITKIKDESNQQ